MTCERDGDSNPWVTDYRRAVIRSHVLLKHHTFTNLERQVRDTTLLTIRVRRRQQNLLEAALPVRCNTS